jgi:hypothetical protein
MTAMLNTRSKASPGGVAPGRLPPNDQHRHGTTSSASTAAAGAYTSRSGSSKQLDCHTTEGFDVTAAPARLLGRC